MGESDWSRQQDSAQTASRLAAAKAQARRRNLVAITAVVVVLAVVVAFVVIKLGGKPSPPSAGSKPAATKTATNVAASVVATVGNDLASVPASAFDTAGAGPAYPAPGGIYPNAVQTVRHAGAVLRSGGKPQVVFVGAEYCPYCAAERWALATALSRFGTFSGLQLIHSSSSDVYPSTPTLSFDKATYTSKYLVFTSTEAATVDETALQPLTALDKTLMKKYDAPPYVPSSQDSGSFPFVDIGNRYVIIGASYDPGLLAGLSWQQIGADLAHPASSAAGRAIDATANRITAAICKITNNKPGNVCRSTGVTSVSRSI